MPRTLKTGIGLAAGLVVLAASVGLCLHLFWPLKHDPQPAAFHCYDLNEGDTIALDTPKRAFGVGLAYAAHIRETASSYTPGAAPPIFEKQVHGWCGDGATVPIPNAQALRDSINTLEPGLGDALDADNLDALVDYEVEMGFVLLEAIDPPQLDTPDFVPKLGFFVANDLSARSVAILGEGQLNRYAWWGASKSFPGFMPVSGRAWVPRQPAANGIPCVNLETRVNEEVRQSQETVDLIYTPREMLVFLRDTFPDATLE
ncbi:MAG: fumarylacetoacetate hydrolase family protein, partial [Myxococcota bacterium]